VKRLENLSNREKLEKDYKKFNESIEGLVKEEMNKTKEESNAVKVEANKIGEDVERSINKQAKQDKKKVNTKRVLKL